MQSSRTPFLFAPLGRPANDCPGLVVGRLLGNNLVDQMARGIDLSLCVAVLITRSYVEKVGGLNGSDNCKKEFSYTEQVSCCLLGSLLLLDRLSTIIALVFASRHDVSSPLDRLHPQAAVALRCARSFM